MAITVPGSGESSNDTQPVDSFTATGPIVESRPNTIEPLIQKFDDIDKVSIDQSNVFGAQKDATAIALAQDSPFNQTPGQASKLLKLEMETGLPSDYIHENMAEIEREASSKGFNIERYQETNPKFTKWVAEHPAHYGIVKDDLGNIDEFSSKIKDYSMMRSLYDSIGAGMGKAVSGVLKAPGLAYDIGAMTLNAGQAAVGSDYRFDRAPKSLYDNAATKYFDDTAKMFQDQNSDLNKSVIDLAINKEYGAAARSALAQVAQSAPQTLSMMAGGMAGLIAAGVSSAAEKASSPENQAAGLTSSTLDAVGVGAFEAIGENFGTFGIMKHWAEALGGRVGKQAAGQIVLNFFKSLAYSVASEGNEEALTSIAQDLTDYATGVNGDELNAEALAQIGKRSVEAGLIGGLSGGLMTGPASAVRASVMKHSEMRASSLQKNLYLALGDTMAASKVRERLPEKHKEMIERMTKDGPVENVYVDPKAFTTYFQAYDGGLAKIIQDLGIEKDYNDATESGTMIKVPLSVWADKVVGTDAHAALADDISFDPDTFTMNESKDVAKLRAENDANTPDENAAPVEGSLEDQILKQLNVASVPGGAKPNATLFATIARNLSKDLGITPEEFVAKKSLTINRLNERLPTKSVNYDEVIKAKDREDFGATLDRIRSGKIPSAEKASGDSLFKFVRKRGGIKLDGVFDGEMNTLPKSLKNKSGMDLDYMRQSAAESGYLPMESSIDDFLRLLAQEDSGDTVYTPQNLNAGMMDEATSLGNLKTQLEGMGVDFASMDNATIQKMIDDGITNKAPAGELGSDIYLQMAGRKAIGANEKLLSKAASMIESGSDMEAVRKETGWFQGPDKRWRFEISDANAKLKPVKIKSGSQYTLGQILDHEELYKNYPHLKDIKVELSLAQTFMLGSWDKAKNLIKIYVTKIPKGYESEYKAREDLMETPEYEAFAEEYRSKRTKDGQRASWNKFYLNEVGAKWKELSDILRDKPLTKPDSLGDIELSTLIHEVQHAIQAHEGFSRGAAAGRSISGKNNYFNSLGEVEARDSESRRTMSDNERTQTGPTTQTWKNPVINWGSVTTELPIESLSEPTQAFVLGEQMTLFQGDKREESPNAQIRFGKDGTANIDFFATANFSSFTHEQAHYWLEMIGDIAQSDEGSARIKDMYSDILGFLGVKDRSEIKTVHHEMFAVAFEKYMMEGKAPTPQLQSMFNTFKAWMTWVYQSLKGLNVELSPEIRSVFDRMLASDEEIARAQKEQGYEPLISIPQMVGMNEAQALKYSELAAQAKSEAEHELTVKAMKQIQRERSSIWKEERAEVKAEMTAKVEGQEDQVLLKILKTGKMEGRGDMRLKLDRKSVVNAFGKEFAEKLPSSVFGKDGFDHESMASMLGFENGWQMLEMLANVQEPKALIEQMTNDEMVARHGHEDVMSNGKLYDEALDAVHNDKRAELMRMEMDWLMQNRTKDAKGMIKSIARRVPTVAMLRQKAQDMISTTVVSDVKPYQFLRAEKKYSNLAVDQLLKGDFTGAYESKKAALLNHELFRAANEAVETMEKSEVRMNKFFQTDEKLSKSRDINIIGAGRAILAGFGFGKDERSPEQHLEQMKQYDPDGYAVLIGRINNAIENADYYKNLTVDQFTALSDLVDGLWNQSKTDKMVEIEGKKIDVAEVREELSKAIDMLPQPKGSNGIDKKITENEKLKLKVLGLKASITRMEFKIDTMDAHTGGIFRKFIYQPVRNATEQYRAKKAEVMTALNELIQGHADQLGGQAIIADNLNYQFKNKAELLGAMIHTGNDSNFKKLLLGNDWGSLREDKTLDTSKWDAFMDKLHKDGTLNKADYEFLEKYWAVVESFKGDTQRAHKEMNGYYFSEITSRELDTPFGKFKGGYAPATPDRMRSKDPAIRNERAIIEDNFIGELPQKNDGFTKARVDNYSTPLIMDLGLITSHIDNALRFTYITPRVKDVMKLVHNRELRSQFDKVDPTFVDGVVIPFLSRASTQKTTTQTQSKYADEFFAFAKNNSAIQLMFLNLPNTIQQVANYIPAALMASPVHIMNAVKETTTNNKAVTEMVTEKSLFMKNKLDGLNEKASMEIENVLRDYNAIERGGTWLSKNAYIAQSMLQNIMDTHVWLASYNQAVANGMSENDSVNYADAATRKTQSSYAAEDTASIETGTPWNKALMMFYGFFNNMGNLYASEWHKASALPGGKAAAKKSLVIANYFLFAFAGKLVIDAVRGRIGGDDDDKESLEFWSKYTFGSAFELAAPMAGLAGQLAYTGYKNLMGESSYNDRISVSPLISSAEQLAKGLKNISKEDPSQKTVTKDLMTLIATAPLISFIPGAAGVRPLAGYAAAIGAAKRPIGYAVGVNEGKDKADDALDVAQGIVSGSKK